MDELNKTNSKTISKVTLLRQIQVLLPIYLNVFMTGCAIGWLPNAIYFTLKHHFSYTGYPPPSDRAFIISSAELGILLLAMPARTLVEKFGRKTIINISGILQLLSWHFIVLNVNVNFVCLARFTLGAGIALINATAMLMIKEIASPEVLPKLTFIYQCFYFGGIAFQCLITVLFRSYIMLSYFDLVVSVIAFIVGTCALETPQYLIHELEFEQALKNLKYVRPEYSENDIECEFNEIKKEIESEELEESINNWLEFFKTSTIRWALIKIFFLNFFGAGTGWFVTLSYITVLNSYDVVLPTIQLPAVGFGLTIIITLLILPICKDKFNAKCLFMIGALLSCISNILFVIFNYGLYLLSFILLGIATIGFIQPVLSTLNKSILPQSATSFGDSLGVVAQALGNITSVVIFQFAFPNYDYYKKFWVCVTNGLILCILAYFFMPAINGPNDFTSSLKRFNFSHFTIFKRRVKPSRVYIA